MGRNKMSTKTSGIELGEAGVLSSSPAIALLSVTSQIQPYSREGFPSQHSTTVKLLLRAYRSQFVYKAAAPFKLPSSYECSG